MAKCKKCGADTKFEGWLCSKCYGQAHKMDSFDIDPDENKGLSDKEYNYRYGMVKGRIAETLIQELFLSLGYNVFRYGMENTIPGIMELLKGVRFDVASSIRRMPDFVIQHKDSKDVFFIEVKFRANGVFTKDNLPKDYPYDNAYIVVVSKRHIKCASVKELRGGEEITPTSKNLLGYRKEFDLNKEVIIDFCNFAIKFFENI